VVQHKTTLVALDNRGIAIVLATCTQNFFQNIFFQVHNLKGFKSPEALLTHRLHDCTLASLITLLQDWHMVGRETSFHC